MKPRRLYQGLTAKAAARHLDKWCHAANRSNINAFMTLSRRIRHHFEGIIAAINHRLSNSRIEGINAGIRLIPRHANGYACLDNLVEMIHLCHGGVRHDCQPAHKTKELAQAYEELSYPVDSVRVWMRRWRCWSGRLVTASPRRCGPVHLRRSWVISTGFRFSSSGWRR